MAESETRADPASALAPSAPGVLRAFWDWVRPVAREWTLIGIEVALAFFGAWAVVSAIACLPIMNEHVVLTQSEEETEQLRAAFESEQDRLPDWSSSLMDLDLQPLCTTPVVDRAPAAEPSPPDGEPAAPPATAVQPGCLQYWRALRSERDLLHDLWRDRRERAVMDLASAARTGHQMALSGLAVPQIRDDYAAHVAQLRRVHLDHADAVASWLHTCRTGIVEADGRLKRDMNEALEDGVLDEHDAADLRARREQPRGPELCALSIPQIRYPANRRSEQRIATLTLLTLGLHTTRSPDLVLLIGMLGCGLLGAGVSSLVRRTRAGREESERTFRVATIADLLSVVVSGFTAAVIVFLAIRSGLPMIADGAHVRPHGLLLMCLLGAAFSDVTWRWAHQRLLDVLPAGGERPSAHPGSEPRPSAARRQGAKDSPPGSPPPSPRPPPDVGDADRPAPLAKAKTGDAALERGPGGRAGSETSSGAPSVPPPGAAE